MLLTFFRVLWAKEKKWACILYINSILGNDWCLFIKTGMRIQCSKVACYGEFAIFSHISFSINVFPLDYKQISLTRACIWIYIHIHIYEWDIRRTKGLANKSRTQQLNSVWYAMKTKADSIKRINEQEQQRQ